MPKILIIMLCLVAVVAGQTAAPESMSGNRGTTAPPQVNSSGINKETSAAHQPAIDPELEKAMLARRDAERNRDVETVDRMTTDDFLLIDQTGRVITRRERLEQIRAGQPRAQAQSDDQLHVYGNTGVPGDTRCSCCWGGNTVLRTRHVVIEGKPLRVMNVWVKENGQWKVAATQVTPELNPQSAH